MFQTVECCSSLAVIREAPVGDLLTAMVSVMVAVVMAVVVMAVVVMAVVVMVVGLVVRLVVGR